MRIEEIKKYIADDGKEFDNEKDCIKYEGTAYTEYMLKDIPHKLVLEDNLAPWCGSCCYGYLFVHASCKEELDAVKEWYESFGRRTFPSDYAGTFVFEVAMTEDFAVSLDKIMSVNFAMPIWEFIHYIIGNTLEAEHYVKHEFGKENAK